MEVENLLTFLLYITIALFVLRMAVNWNLLNKVEDTNQPIMQPSNPTKLILTFRHLVISYTKIWWTGNEYKAPKLISNILSILLYVSILGTVAIFITHYKLGLW